MRFSENWSQQRRIAAQHIASVLYGVIAVMSADLVAQPDRLTYTRAGLGVLLIGSAMMITHLFVHVVTKETERGVHLSVREFAEFVRDSLWVMLFPVMTAAWIVVGALAAVDWKVLLDDILYIGMASVFVIGFLSSYILDREFWPALRRGIVWLVLSVALTAVKSLV